MISYSYNYHVFYKVSDLCMLDPPLEISKHANHHGEQWHLKASEMPKSLKGFQLKLWLSIQLCQLHLGPQTQSKTIRKNPNPVFQSKGNSKPMMIYISNYKFITSRKMGSIIIDILELCGCPSHPGC